MLWNSVFFLSFAQWACMYVGFFSTCWTHFIYKIQTFNLVLQLTMVWFWFGFYRYSGKQPHSSKLQLNDESERSKKREELLRWMKERKSQRLKEYRSQRQTLQQQEAKPFQSVSIVIHNEIYKLVSYSSFAYYTYAFLLADISALLCRLSKVFRTKYTSVGSTLDLISECGFNPYPSSFAFQRDVKLLVLCKCCLCYWHVEFQVKL